MWWLKVPVCYQNVLCEFSLDKCYWTEIILNGISLPSRGQGSNEQTVFLSLAWKIFLDPLLENKWWSLEMKKTHLIGGLGYVSWFRFSTACQTGWCFILYYCKLGVPDRNTSHFDVLNIIEVFNICQVTTELPAATELQFRTSKLMWEILVNCLICQEVTLTWS